MACVDLSRLARHCGTDIVRIFSSKCLFSVIFCSLSITFQTSDKAEYKTLLINEFN